MMLFIMHPQFPSHMHQFVFPTASDEHPLHSLWQESTIASTPFMAQQLQHLHLSFCSLNEQPVEVFHLRCQKRYNFDKSSSSSIPESLTTYSFLPSCSLSSSHPTQLQLAAESHRMVCQFVRVSMKDTASNRVGLQHGWVLTSRPKMLPFSVRILSAMS